LTGGWFVRFNIKVFSFYNTGGKVSQSSNSEHVWWGSWKMAAGETRRWRIGPTTLWIQWTRYELHIVQEIGDDPLDTALEIANSVTLDTLERVGMPERFVRRQRANTLLLSPALADRAIVTRPETPFYISPGEEVLLYVSSPLWVHIELDPPRQLLRELPTFRPSDTWFGPSTITGELCYASRTHCRLELEDLPFRPHRAVTPVFIHNQVNASLLLERLSIPVPYLSVFLGSDGHLWTQAIKITREDEKEGLAQLAIEKGPPGNTPEAQRIAGPRQESAASLLVRAFSKFF
jgi:hypothetical protein